MGDGGGLRERKRRAAMRRIQRAAVALFDQHGYSRVPIEKIAEAAEVSPSSVYRYFGTKEHIVLWDEYDEAALELLREELQRHPPIAAVRTAVDRVVATMLDEDAWYDHRRWHYMFEEPAVAAASFAHAHRMAHALTDILADHLGRPRGDVELGLFAHAAVGGMLAAVHHWFCSPTGTHLTELMDQLFDSLAHGFLRNVGTAS